MRDEPGAPCPDCGAAATRQFFPAGIVFKGSGFYKTDSRGSSSSSITSDGGESKSAAASTKTDAGKPEKTPTSSETPTTATKKPASADAAS